LKVTKDACPVITINKEGESNDAGIIYTFLDALGLSSMRERIRIYHTF